MVEDLKTFRDVLKLLEYIVVLHTLPCVGRKLSYNFTKKIKNKPPPLDLLERIRYIEQWRNFGIGCPWLSKIGCPLQKYLMQQC